MLDFKVISESVENEVSRFKVLEFSSSSFQLKGSSEDKVVKASYKEMPSKKRAIILTMESGRKKSVFTLDLEGRHTNSTISTYIANFIQDCGW